MNWRDSIFAPQTIEARLRSHPDMCRAEMQALDARLARDRAQEEREGFIEQYVTLRGDTDWRMADLKPLLVPYDHACRLAEAAHELAKKTYAEVLDRVLKEIDGQMNGRASKPKER